ncbi:MAG: site-specific integrase [Patescibacteria group bacterium]|nr:site-specific integrase [Patescibacteria group bacterium]
MICEEEQDIEKVIRQTCKDKGWTVRRFYLDRGCFTTKMRKTDEEPELIKAEDDQAGRYKYKLEYFRSTNNNRLTAYSEFKDWFEDVLKGKKDQKNISIEQMFTDFLETGEVDLRPSTKKDWERSIFGRFLPGLESQKIKLAREVKKQHVTKLISNLKYHKKNPERETAIKTRLNYFDLLKMIFEWATRHDYVEGNPLVWRPPKKWRRKLFEKQQEKVGVALNYEQAQNLLKISKTSFIKKIIRGKDSWKQKYEPPKHLYTALLIALRSGLRFGNIIGNSGIKWKHIDRKNWTFDIPAENMKGDHIFKVPIHPELIDHFKDLEQKYTEKHNHIPKKDCNDYVIAGEPKKYITKSFKQALKRADLESVRDEEGRLKKFRFHDLRHSFKTWIEEEEGLPQSVVKELMGWKGSSLHERYGHKRATGIIREKLSKTPWLFPKKSEQNIAENQ